MRNHPDGQLNLVERAARYVTKMDTAVAGQNGHGALFAAARALVHGFGLADHEAWPILTEYNTRCMPPWSEAELRHKLKQAAERTTDQRPRGHLAGNSCTPRLAIPVRPPAPPRRGKPVSPVAPLNPKPPEPNPDPQPPAENPPPDPPVRHIEPPEPQKRAGGAYKRAAGHSMPPCPAGCCPVCWIQWSRWARIGNCVCTGHIVLGENRRGAATAEKIIEKTCDSHLSVR